MKILEFLTFNLSVKIDLAKMKIKSRIFVHTSFSRACQKNSHDVADSVKGTE